MAYITKITGELKDFPVIAEATALGMVTIFYKGMIKSFNIGVFSVDGFIAELSAIGVKSIEQKDIYIPLDKEALKTFLKSC